MATKTPKDLAEATAAMALDSLRAALAAEAELRANLREQRRLGRDWALTAATTERELADAVHRSDAAFEAWRQACEAVPT